MFDQDVLRRVIGPEHENSELGGLVKHLIEAATHSIAENGLLGLEDILADGGRPFPNLPDDVAIIPGTRAGPCPRVVVAIATKTNPRAKFGGINVMRQLRDMLIKCCNARAGQQLQAAIFIGPIGVIEQVMEESAGDIEGHLSNGILRVFVPVGILRGQVNVLSWR